MALNRRKILKSNTKKALAAMAFLFVGSTASAAVVTYLQGDVDGAATSTGYAGTITDKEVTGLQSWTQSFTVPGTITSATIEVANAALGYNPPAGVPRLFLDNVLVDALKDMDECDGSAAPGVLGCTTDNYTSQLLSISNFSSFNDGISNFTIDTSSGDVWVLDFSELSITTVEVPKPSSVALLGPGLLGFATSRRKSGFSKSA